MPASADTPLALHGQRVESNGASGTGDAGAWGILARVLAWLPFRTLVPLGAVIGWLAGSVLRIRRAHVESAMRRAGIAAPQRAARAMYRALGASVLELLWMARAPVRASAHARFDEASRAALEGAVAKGRGVVLAASHTGNWELAAAAIAEACALSAVTKRIHAPSVDAFMRGARASRGWDATTGAGVLPRAQRALARGEVVAMMIDQVPDRRRHALALSFLGAQAYADKAPATLAARMGAPLVVVAASRDANGDQALRVLTVLDPPSRGPRARYVVRHWIDEATRAASCALEQHVRAYPADWLWLHRRWRDVT